IFELDAAALLFLLEDGDDLTLAHALAQPAEGGEHRLADSVGAAGHQVELVRALDGAQLLQNRPGLRKLDAGKAGDELVMAIHRQEGPLDAEPGDSRMAGAYMGDRARHRLVAVPAAGDDMPAPDAAVLDLVFL